MKGQLRYRCTNPAVGELVYDYHNGSLSLNETKKFRGHALICGRCQKTLRRLTWISKTIGENPKEFFTAKEVRDLQSLVAFREQRRVELLEALNKGYRLQKDRNLVKAEPLHEAYNALKELLP